MVESTFARTHCKFVIILRMATVGGNVVRRLLKIAHFQGLPDCRLSEQGRYQSHLPRVTDPFSMQGQKSRSGPGFRPGFEGGQMPSRTRFPRKSKTSSAKFQFVGGYIS
ncbi:hypothetical protein ACFX2G_031016 [Malus domestica]